jgi:hypothetical protein
VHFEVKTLPQKVFEEAGLQLPLIVHSLPDDPQLGDAEPFIVSGPPRTYPVVREGYSQLVSIGNSFAALLISLVAGVIAEAVVRKKQKSVP